MLAPCPAVGPERPATCFARGVEGFGGCKFFSSSFLNNSGCLGLSGLNLTDIGGEGGGLRGGGAEGL